MIHSISWLCCCIAATSTAIFSIKGSNSAPIIASQIWLNASSKSNPVTLLASHLTLCSSPSTSACNMIFFHVYTSWILLPFWVVGADNAPHGRLSVLRHRFQPFLLFLFDNQSTFALGYKKKTCFRTFYRSKTGLSFYFFLFLGITKALNLCIKD